MSEDHALAFDPATGGSRFQLAAHLLGASAEPLLGLLEGSRAIEPARTAPPGNERLTKKLQAVGIVHNSRFSRIQRQPECRQLLGDQPTAIRSFEQQLDLARAIGDQQGEANALGNLGAALTDVGAFDAALRYCQEHVDLRRRLGQQVEESTALGHLGKLYLELDDAERALAAYSAGLAISRSLGDRDGESWHLSGLGSAYRTCGDLAQARACYEQAIQISYDLNDAYGAGIDLGNLGTVYAALESPQEALVCYRQARTMLEASGDRAALAMSDWNIGEMLILLGEIDLGIASMHRRIDYLRSIDHALLESCIAELDQIRQRIQRQRAEREIRPHDDPPMPG